MYDRDKFLPIVASYQNPRNQFALKDRRNQLFL